jgi:hypothetical protein
MRACSKAWGARCFGLRGRLGSRLLADAGIWPPVGVGVGQVLELAGVGQVLELASFFEDAYAHCGAFSSCCTLFRGIGSFAMDLLLATISPPPLSPLFQSGGSLEGFNEDVTFIVALMLLLLIFDVLGSRVLGISQSARWFFVHAIANAVSTVAAFPDVRRALWEDPIHCFSGKSHSMVANSAVAAAHFYHVVAFKLRAEDIFHHVVFTAVLCGIAIPFKHDGGALNNFGCFILSGLPGGIDYCMLVGVKQGWMAKLTEKSWNAWINTWIRGPAMSVYGFLAWQAWLLGNYNVPTVFLFLVAFLHFTNGQHYAAQAVASHEKWRIEAKSEKRS